MPQGIYDGECQFREVNHCLGAGKHARRESALHGADMSSDVLEMRLIMHIRGKAGDAPFERENCEEYWTTEGMSKHRAKLGESSLARLGADLNTSCHEGNTDLLGDYVSSIMSSPLPPELVEIILTHLPDDAKAPRFLRHYALVARAWSIPCQRNSCITHLPAHLRCYPHLQNYIRHVTMSQLATNSPESESCIAALSALFSLMPRLISMDITFTSDCIPWADSNRRFLKAFGAFLHTSSLDAIVVHGLAYDTQLGEMFSYLENTKTKRVSLQQDGGYDYDAFDDRGVVTAKNIMPLPGLEFLRVDLWRADIFEEDMGSERAEMVLEVIVVGMLVLIFAMRTNVLLLGGGTAVLVRASTRLAVMLSASMLSGLCRTTLTFAVVIVEVPTGGLMCSRSASEMLGVMIFTLLAVTLEVLLVTFSTMLVVVLVAQANVLAVHACGHARHACGARARWWWWSRMVLAAVGTRGRRWCSPWSQMVLAVVADGARSQTMGKIFTHQEYGSWT
ncbi:hypothetical protein BDZ89DRAFT_1045170 [Hymenopellis radicata]|nr:hypothetical protein BDZ89DRAFT_1045170 [Hymenopellis radicata]